MAPGIRVQVGRYFLIGWVSQSRESVYVARSVWKRSPLCTIRESAMGCSPSPSASSGVMKRFFLRKAARFLVGATSLLLLMLQKKCNMEHKLHKTFWLSEPAKRQSWKSCLPQFCRSDVTASNRSWSQATVSGLLTPRYYS